MVVSELPELVAELREHLAVVRRGGSESARKKHTDRGKLLVRDRIDRLLDPGSPFLELSPLAAFGLYGASADDAYAVPSASIVTGIGRVCGREVVVEGAPDGSPGVGGPPIPQRRPSSAASSSTGNRNVTYSGGGMSQPSALAMAAAGSPEAAALAQEAAEEGPVDGAPPPAEQAPLPTPTPAKVPGAYAKSP